MTQHPPEGDFLASGTVLRDCEIESVVGRGGFGIVYKGRHRMLQSDVAIKEYFPRELAQRRSGVVQPTESGIEASFDDGLRRFLEEGRRLEAFRDHPNIVTCRDLFRANGTAYMVMDFVDGLPLSALLEQREKNGEPFTERDLLHVILPLLDGLNRVHESGLYHRDIKPSNILIRRKDNEPVLIDFGAAKQETEGATKSMAPYTDGYAAMEQIGEGEIGPWTDIYGVGALMWRVVAGGNPPWKPPSPTKVQQRAYAVLQGRADPLPSTSAVGSGRFSPRLLQAIDQCLEISDSTRIRSCSVLVAKIRVPDMAALAPSAATAVRIRETLSQPRLEKRARRGRPAVQLMLALAILFLVIVAVRAIAPGSAANASLTLVTHPANARVEFVEHGVTYRDGIALRPGMYTLRVSQAGYEPETIQIVHGVQGTRRQVTLKRTATATLTVETVPANARVEFDSQSISYREGMTLRPGTYTLRVSQAGYEPETIQIVHGVQGTRRQVTLKRTAAATLTVETVPANARVEFDSQSISYREGMTLRPGTYTLRVSQAGYEPETIQIVHGVQGTRRQVTLKRTAAATLTVETVPANARVEFNSQSISYREGMTLRPGTYTLKVSQSGYESETIQIVHGVQGTRRQVTLKRTAAATLTVETVPANARVEFDSQSISYREGMTLRPGTYTLKVSQAGYESETVQVRHGTQATRHWVRLKPTSAPSSRTERSSYFTRGSSMDEVLQVQGTPTGANIYESLGQEVWDFGRSTVTFDFKTKKVKEWSNRSGNLKVRMQPQVTASVSYFTRGSSMDEVLQVQGTPTGTNIYESLGQEVWDFGRSTVTFDFKTKKVKEWSNRSGNLKVRMQPQVTASVSYFTRGSSMDEVLQVQGTPTGTNIYESLGQEVWDFGRSTVTFDFKTKKVKEWSNRSGNLKVRMQPQVTASVSYFTRGSSMDEVLQVQGTPTGTNIYESLGQEVWDFGRSTVTFDFKTKKVKEWSNRSGNLKVRMQPQVTASVSYFTRGSSMDEVLQVQGTPTGTNIYESLGQEVWDFGRSTVTFDFKTKKVKEWSNRSGNLKVRM